MKCFIWGNIIAIIVCFTIFACVVPPIHSVDPETKTITVDEGSIKPEDVAALEKLGLKIEKIDVIQEEINENLAKTHDALKGVADILKLTARKSDIAVRYGGEEFCVILPEEDLESAYNFAERLRKAVESNVFAREEVQPGGRLTVSLGVASFPKDADSAQELMEKA